MGDGRHFSRTMEKILDCHEAQAPLSHIKRFELVKGDPCERAPQYFNENRETIVAMAHFNLKLYRPTKICLETIKDRLTKGSVLAFYELNEHVFPGESQAFREVFGLDHYPIRRVLHNPQTAYVVIE